MLIVFGRQFNNSVFSRRGRAQGNEVDVRDGDFNVDLVKVGSRRVNALKLTSIATFSVERHGSVPAISWVPPLSDLGRTREFFSRTAFSALVHHANWSSKSRAF